MKQPSKKRVATVRRGDEPAEASDRLIFLSPADLRPNPKNARIHSKKQVRKIADSIEAFSFVNPILIDETGMVLAGHGRLEAARLLGLATIPCRRIAHLSAAEKRAYALADNKLALNAGWDEELLANELQELLDLDLGFDIGVIGFEASEIDILIEAPQSAEAEYPEDDRLPALEEAAVSRAGDLWILGPHRLYCGNALALASYERVLGDERAQMVFSDPPYNVPIDGHASGLGKVKHREFAMAAGEMSKAQFTEFLKAAFSLCASWSIDGSIHYHFMDWRHMGEMLAAGEAIYDELKNVCVWVKHNAGMGSLYRSKHELLFVFKKGGAPHVNNVELGANGRYRTNVWSYRGATSGGKARLEELALHPTLKPVAMIADAMRDCSARGGIVLDPFAGSGSTLIAAERAKRRARLIEIDPVYVDRAIRRWQAFAHDDAILAETGETFDARAGARAQAVSDGVPDVAKARKTGAALIVRGRRGIA